MKLVDYFIWRTPRKFTLLLHLEFWDNYSKNAIRKEVRLHLLFWEFVWTFEK